MKCRNCGREVIKTTSPHLHPNGYMHREVPNWNCGYSRDHNHTYTKEHAEPILFTIYLKELEK